MNVPQLVEDLKRDEGVMTFPYHCTEGKLTIGVGRNLEDVGLSDHEIEFLLANDISRVLHAIEGSIYFYRDLNEVRQRALANMGFQLGVNGLHKFKNMLKAMSEGDFEKAAMEALDSKWARQTPNRAARMAEMIRSGK